MVGWLLSLNITPGWAANSSAHCTDQEPEVQGIRGDSEKQRGKKSQRKSGARTLGNPAKIGRDLLMASIKGE